DVFDDQLDIVNYGRARHQSLTSSSDGFCHTFGHSGCDLTRYRFDAENERCGKTGQAGSNWRRGFTKTKKLVRWKGFEPSRYCYRQPLKLVRLPVPPPPQKQNCRCSLCLFSAHRLRSRCAASEPRAPNCPAIPEKIKPTL